jgi:aliphatic nitrilase
MARPGVDVVQISRVKSRFLAAAVQRTPAYLDVDATTRLAIDSIREAAAAGAELVVFPETWLSGYPHWVFSERRDHEATAELYDKHFKSSVTIPGPHVEQIAAAARRARTTVAIGVHERDARGGTLYNTLCYLDANGALLGKHRKLVPTEAERIVWGRGDGSDLDVYETPLGRIGGLICYEHQMAPARYALAGLGIEVHVSVWPGFALIDPVVDAATRHLAYENACFVVVAREVMSKDRLPKGTPLADDPFWETHGGSAIIAPGGAYLAGPVFDEETILYAEIDLDAIIASKRMVDSVGHYARPDVFQLRWDRRPKAPVVISEED